MEVSREGDDGIDDDIFGENVVGVGAVLADAAEDDSDGDVDYIGAVAARRGAAEEDSDSDVDYIGAAQRGAARPTRTATASWVILGRWRSQVGLWWRCPRARRSRLGLRVICPGPRRRGFNAGGGGPSMRCSKRALQLFQRSTASRAREQRNSTSYCARGCVENVQNNVQQ